MNPTVNSENRYVPTWEGEFTSRYVSEGFSCVFLYKEKEQPLLKYFRGITSQRQEQVLYRRLVTNGAFFPVRVMKGETVLLVDHIQKRVWASKNCIPFEVSHLPPKWKYMKVDDAITEAWLASRVRRSVNRDFESTPTTSKESKPVLSPNSARKVKRISGLRIDSRTFSSDKIKLPWL